MKLDKAIEALTQVAKNPRSAIRMDFPQAARLGVEALERHQARNHLTFAGILEPLPSETPIIDNTRSLHHIKQSLETPRTP